MIRRVVCLSAALIAAAAALFLLWFFFAVFADRSHPVATTQTIVPRGSTFREIASRLAADGVIAHPLAMQIYAKLRHADTEVKAGEYRFAPHQTQAEILGQLLVGGAQVAKWVTFPEGFTAKQMAARLQDEGFGSAQTFARFFLHDTIVVDGTRTKSLEGFLFPSTYLFPVGASPRTVASIMTRQFFRELPKDALEKARALHLDVPQVVTVASLVEREAQADDERALIAGVIYNRLRLRMPLQVDASLEYAFSKHQTVITERDLQIRSPYNTYEHEGLPPTPIANPGEPSLLAAFNPKASQYLYYVYAGNGHHAFAKTLAEQNANVAKYLK
ncbi:MAG: endolytic transglycosylase MltG [Vulcanimicrobiaceae bacterium]